MAALQHRLRTGKIALGVGRLYAGLSWLLAAAIIAQVFLAGLNVFLAPRYWASHISLGHAIGGGVLLALVLALLGRLPCRVQALNGLMLLLFALQYNHRLLAGALGVPGLAALHAVNALLLFWCAVTLGRWSWAWLRRS